MLRPMDPGSLASLRSAARDDPAFFVHAEAWTLSFNDLNAVIAAKPRRAEDPLPHLPSRSTPLRRQGSAYIRTFPPYPELSMTAHLFSPITIGDLELSEPHRGGADVPVFGR